MNNIKFEDALLELESHVKKLESGNIALDEAISVYEDAVRLVKLCHEKLDSAEQKLKILIEGEDGLVYDRPFVNTDEN